MRKTFVIDTNVLLQSPNAMLAFGDNKVVLAEAVMEEIDNFKKGHSDLNVNARTVARFLDGLRKKGRLTEGVEMENGGLLKVETNHKDIKLPPNWEIDKADNRILQVCVALKEQGEDVYLITKDIMERIKADIMDVIAQDFESERAPELDEQYKGRRSVYVTDSDINKFYEQGYLTIGQGQTMLLDFDINGNCTQLNEELFPNEFLVIISADTPAKTALAKVSGDLKSIVKLQFEKEFPYGVKPRNVGQKFMQEALMTSTDDVPLVILKGPAGTAKTFYSLAVGLEKVVETREFRRVLVCRPNCAMDEEAGFLPGSEQEKIAPLMRPIMDNLEILVDSDKKERYDSEKELAGKVAFLFEKGFIDTQAVGFLRGRSIVKHWLIIDECLTGDNKIMVDGRKPMSLLNLYNNYNQGKELPLALSYNESTGIFEYKRILNVIDKGARDIVEVKAANRKIKCTPEHPFLTKRGWIEAGKLLPGDILMMTSPNSLQSCRDLNDDQLQIVIGSYLGDGGITTINKNRYRLSITHGLDQHEYCEWKASMFNAKTEFIAENGYSKKPAIRFNSPTFCMPEQFDKGKKNNIPQWLIDKMDLRAIAIWVMDDGSIGTNSDFMTIPVCSFDEDSVERLSNKLSSLGIDNIITKCREYPMLRLNKESFNRIKEGIITYIHSSMIYKIRESKVFWEPYAWNNNYRTNGLTVITSVNILDKQEKVYDIEVEDNHNFAVTSGCMSKDRNNYTGIIVHNCQNLSPRQAKAIITRAGEGTKIILCGDPEQIDNPFLDQRTNGLSYACEMMRGSALCAQITAEDIECVRSRLAMEGAQRMR